MNNKFLNDNKFMNRASSQANLQSNGGQEQFKRLQKINS